MASHTLPLPEFLVQSHLAALRATVADEVAFDEAVLALALDRQVTFAILRDIASAFTGRDLRARFDSCRLLRAIERQGRDVRPVRLTY
jgi:hypothetical protein